MTEQERVALHGLKGTIQAQISINQIRVNVGNEFKAAAASEWMEGNATGHIEVATLAIEQGLVLLAELDKILEGAYNG